MGQEWPLYFPYTSFFSPKYGVRGRGFGWKYNKFQRKSAPRKGPTGVPLGAKYLEKKPYLGPPRGAPKSNGFIGFGRKSKDFIGLGRESKDSMGFGRKSKDFMGFGPVSYTHLTLPTKA